MAVNCSPVSPAHRRGIVHARNIPLSPVAQGLRSGCCPDPAPAGADGSPRRRHLIRSHHYKNATNEDGHHISAGVERARTGHLRGPAR